MTCFHLSGPSARLQRRLVAVVGGLGHAQGEAHFAELAMDQFGRRIRVGDNGRNHRVVEIFCRNRRLATDRGREAVLGYGDDGRLVIPEPLPALEVRGRGAAAIPADDAPRDAPDGLLFLRSEVGIRRGMIPGDAGC
jgi:hypothetical protein